MSVFSSNFIPSITYFLTASKSAKLLKEEKSSNCSKPSKKIPNPKKMDKKIVSLPPPPGHPFTACPVPRLSPIPINCCYYGPPPLWRPNPLMNMYPNPYMGFFQPSNPFLFRGNVFGNPFSQLNCYPSTHPYTVKKTLIFDIFTFLFLIQNIFQIKK